jgi:hypothetical protein
LQRPGRQHDDARGRLGPADGGEGGAERIEGSLWVGQYRGRKIVQIDPDTGAVLRIIESTRFVTGVAWVEGELWHGTWEEEQAELRHIDAATGEVLEQLDMPPGIAVSGLDSDGGERLLCGGSSSGKIRAVRRPSAKKAQSPNA